MPLDQADASAFLAKHTLGRFPNVGAIVAGTSRAETHEWDLYQGGVFTHQLLSGLRGAGDVNGDGRVEYSEIFAFLTAANAAVSEPAARLSVSVRAPASKPNIPIVRLTDLRQHGTLILTGSTKPRPTYVEDDRGERLADFNPESRFRVSRPSRPTGSCSSGTVGRADVSAGDGADPDPVADRPPAPRRAVAWSHRRHIPTGSVPGPIRIRLLPGTDEPAAGPHTNRPVRTADALPVTEARRSRLPAWLSFGGAAVLGATSATTGVVTLAAREDFQNTPYQRPAAEAYSRHRRFRTISVVTAIAAATAAAVGFYLWPSDSTGSRPMSRRSSPWAPGVSSHVPAIDLAVRAGKWLCRSRGPHVQEPL